MRRKDIAGQKVVAKPRKWLNITMSVAAIVVVVLICCMFFLPAIAQVICTFMETGVAYLTVAVSAIIVSVIPGRKKNTIICIIVIVLISGGIVHGMSSVVCNMSTNDSEELIQYNMQKLIFTDKNDDVNKAEERTVYTYTLIEYESAVSQDSEEYKKYAIHTEKANNIYVEGRRIYDASKAIFEDGQMSSVAFREAKTEMLRVLESASKERLEANKFVKTSQNLCMLAIYANESADFNADIYEHKLAFRYYEAAVEYAVSSLKRAIMGRTEYGMNPIDVIQTMLYSYRQLHAQERFFVELGMLREEDVEELQKIITVFENIVKRLHSNPVLLYNPYSPPISQIHQQEYIGGDCKLLFLTKKCAEWHIFFVKN